MESRENILLKMHEFYAEEARNQRSVMWDTVKWFTPILTGIHAGWFFAFLKESINQLYPLLLSIAGGVLCVICWNLLKSFYRTNLIYVSMLAKVEDDLPFDERRSTRYFSRDTRITYEKYAIDRLNYESALKYVTDTIRKGTMHRSMRYVFHVFFVGFLYEFFMTIMRINQERGMDTAIVVFSIVLAVTGIWLLAWGLRINVEQEDLSEKLKLPEKSVLAVKDVKQRVSRLYWGLALVTIAVLILIYRVLHY